MDTMLRKERAAVPLNLEAQYCVLGHGLTLFKSVLRKGAALGCRRGCVGPACVVAGLQAGILETIRRSRTGT